MKRGRKVKGSGTWTRDGRARGIGLSEKLIIKFKTITQTPG